VNAANGKLVYEERLQPVPGRIYASATEGAGKVYYVSRESGTYVVAAQPEFKQLAHNTLKSDPSICNASPALADGMIYLRSDRFLYCIGAGRSAAR
jgi:outer membrane protein assembly factor BamB